MGALKVNSLLSFSFSLLYLSTSCVLGPVDSALKQLAERSLIKTRIVPHFSPLSQMLTQLVFPNHGASFITRNFMLLSPYYLE